MLVHRTFFRWLLLTFLALGFSCKQETDEPGIRLVDNVPYYFFTDADQRWLQLQQGDIWQFENSNGIRRTYEVYYRLEQLKQAKRTTPPMGSLIFTSKLLYYYDHLLIRVARTDSAGSGGELNFYRNAAQLTTRQADGYDKFRSRFYAEGRWSEFVGNTDIPSDYFDCRGLKFPSGPALDGPFQQLTVRGRQYNEVIVFAGTYRGDSCAPVPASFMQELYYDRRAGIVRMVSTTGDVWERLP